MGAARNDGEASSLEDRRLSIRLARGDADGLRLLMDKYDRLVRFSIFRLTRDRCARDPDWLDTVAGDVWTAFVRAVQGSSERWDAPRALLMRIARNRAVSALRGAIRQNSHNEASLDTVPHDDLVDAATAESSDTLDRLESLDALQACVKNLPDDDRRLTEQLEAILEKRWETASRALGLPESTLRSRWKRVIDQLRTCLETKTDRSFAPGRSDGDS